MTVDVQRAFTTGAMPSPTRTATMLLVIDTLAVLGALFLAIWLRYLWDRSLLWDIYLELWPMLFLFPLAYALAGLYGVGIAPPEELRRLSYATSLVFVVLGAATFMYKAGADYSRGAFVFAWGLALVLVPLSRALVRELFARKPWWGAAVLVLGAGKTGEAVVRALCKQPGPGFKPIALLDDDPAKQGQQVEGVPVAGGLERAAEFARMGVQHVIVAMPGVERGRLLKLLEQHGANFPHVILIPDLFGLASLWVTSRDLGGVLGLEVRQRLLLPGPRIVKRILDIAIIVVCFLPVAIIGALIYVLIKLDSPGPAFYSQERLGFRNSRFKVLKFRTMYGDGEEILQRVLLQNPHLLAEYEQFHKLKDDPRVTRVGKVLRALSLDELPQLWNVLRGEMSLVGPRAYLPREVNKMSGTEAIILQVLPGITGLWQVSGRNELAFSDRLALDTYYVRNWSSWLDLYILARTVWVVLFGKGAY